MLFFKLNLDAQLLQVTDGLQQIHRVSRKAGDGFGQDDVDVSRFAFSQHFLKLRPVDLGTGDAVIGIHASVHPAGMLLDELAVVADLRGE